MLSKEENELITRTGAGTPMGNAMRRYWLPACLSSEIDEPDGAPVRVISSFSSFESMRVLLG